MAATAAEVHPTAIVDARAELAAGVRVGPFAVIEGPVRVGAGTVIHAYAYVAGDTVLGERNAVHMGAVIGTAPALRGFDPGTPSGVRIGHGNHIRERVSIHRAAVPGAFTRLGDGNFVMGGTRIAHGCALGDRNIIANDVVLGAGARLADRAVVAGGVPIAPGVRIGELAMLWGYTVCERDVPPFMSAFGRSRVVGFNVIGVRRAADIDRAGLAAVKLAYKTLYRSGKPVGEALDELEARGGPPVLERIVRFCRASTLGICAAGAREDLDAF